MDDRLSPPLWNIAASCIGESKSSRVFMSVEITITIKPIKFSIQKNHPIDPRMVLGHLTLDKV